MVLAAVIPYGIFFHFRNPIGVIIDVTSLKLNAVSSRQRLCLTAICMHYMDANKTAREGTRRKLHKNVESSIEQVLATTPHETPTIRTPAPITKTIQVRRARHAGHCWRSKDELISDVLLWTPTYLYKFSQMLCIFLLYFMFTFTI